MERLKRTGLWICALWIIALGAHPLDCEAAGGPSREARRHFESGQRLARRGDRRAAIAAFSSAYSLTKKPDLLYDIAQQHRLLATTGSGVDARPAIEHFHRYLEAKPDARERRSIEKYLVELDVIAARANAKPVSTQDSTAQFTPKNLGAKTPLEAPDPANRRPAPPPIAMTDPAAPRRGSERSPISIGDRRSLLPPALVAAVALGAAVVGAGLVASVSPEYDALRGRCGPSCPRSDWSDLQTREWIGHGFFALAGTAAVVDAFLWSRSALARRERLTHLVPAGLTGIAIQGRF